MDNPPNQQAGQTTPFPAPAVVAPGAPPPPFQHHLLQQQQQQLQMFWSYQRQEIEQVNDFKNHQLPLARIKKIMKADEDVRMISAEAPILFAKACELFILELTIRSWLHAEENKRRTLQKNDIAAAITRTDIFDFLVDIVPRDEIRYAISLGLPGRARVSNVLLLLRARPLGLVQISSILIRTLHEFHIFRDDGMVGVGAGAGAGAGVGAGGVGVGVGVPSYYYPPPGGMMIGRPAMDPSAGVYVQPPSQAWQSVWQNATPDDGSYGSGGQANQDGQG